MGKWGFFIFCREITGGFAQKKTAEGPKAFGGRFIYFLSMTSLPPHRYTSNTPTDFPLTFSMKEAGFFSSDP